MDYSFHPNAETELNRSIDYYNECQENLGFEFAEEVYKSIQHILALPHAWSEMTVNTRRCLTERFPYGIIYQIESNHIYIIAVMQLNQKPDYWRSLL